MAKKVALKKFTGVYVTESTVRKWRERPDRCYWIGFKDAHGKLCWERCGWASEGWTPEAAQRRRYELLESDRVGSYKPKQERRAEQLTMGELMEQHYLPWSDQNKRRARDDRSLWQNWLKAPLGHKSLKDIGALDLERLKKDMREAGKAPATIQHVLGLVRQAFNKATLWGLYHGPNPCKAVAFPKINNGRQRFLSQEEADTLFEALRRHSLKVSHIATFSLYGGLRLGEVLALRWGNVDLANGIIYVQDTKNKESRAAFITEPIRQVLQELSPGDPDDLLFQTKNQKPVQWLSKTFFRVVEHLGLNTGVTDPRERVTFHTLRHTYASWAVMAGVPLYIVGKAIGHRTLTMTQRYAHLAPESHRVAFEAVAQSFRGVSAAPLKVAGEKQAIRPHAEALE
jgi:integrase